MYAFAGDATCIPASVSSEQQRLQDTHRQLGHVSFKRMRDLRVKGTDTLTRSSKRQQRAPTCPVCVTAKMRRAPAPTTSSSTKYPQPWQKVYIDLSGKMRVRSYTNAYYFIVFVCDYSGARYCDFVAKKSDFIIAYRRFLQHLQVVPKEIHTDKGGEQK